MQIPRAGVFGRAHEKNTGLRAVASPFVMLGNGAQEIPARSPVMSASHRAALAWYSRRMRFNTVP